MLPQSSFREDRQGGIQRDKLNFLVIGSPRPYDKVKDASILKLSMSRMTFPHQLSRLILLEQLYRSFAISAGSKYHK
jgi:23S rRNA (pseudouridine1915-N3)-methyltransferase